MNNYRKLRQEHQTEMNNFSIGFAFDEKQFKESMEMLGLTEHDTNKVYSIGAGGFIRKTDSKAYNEMNNRFDDEMRAAIEGDQIGEGFIKDMFKCEMANHEYGYTYDLDDTLDALGLTMEEIGKSEALKNGLSLAKREYLESVE